MENIDFTGKMIDASEREYTEGELQTLCLRLVENKDNVQSLDLHEISLNDTNCGVLALCFYELKSLHDLSLCWNALTVIGLEQLIPSWTNNSKLRDLYLAGNVGIADSGVELLAKSGLLVQLEVLDLGECGIGFEGAIILANALPESSLKELSLGLNKDLGDDGMRALCNVLPRCKLESLDVTQCSITDSGVTPLAIALNACPKLREIRMNDNEITDVGALLLREALRQSLVVCVLDLEGNDDITQEMLTEVYTYLKPSQLLYERQSSTAAAREDDEEEE